LEDLIRRLQSQEALAELVGRSRALLEAIASIPAIASSDASTLITGETGTGKELVARAIHYLSKRAKNPFVALNCGSLPESLVEEELFGHERGAFTGALSSRRGLIAEADKGTLFLDEINGMPEKAQVALLRVLQEKRFRAIGSNIEHKVDVRVLAASNEAPEKLANSQRFRKDLYYRICIFSVRLPPLRERMSDITLLAEHFLEKHDAPGLRLSSEAITALQNHDWPGNVRELESCIIRATHLCTGGLICVSDLFEDPGIAARPECIVDIKTEPFKCAKQRIINDFERKYLVDLISSHQGNVTQAARAAGKERRDLGKLLKKHQVDPGNFRCG
jgi:DNA-binding NtrC family response regulator